MQWSIGILLPRAKVLNNGNEGWLIFNYLDCHAAVDLASFLSGIVRFRFGGAHAFGFDLVRGYLEFPDDEVPNRISAFLGKLVVVIRLTRYVRMAFDDDLCEGLGKQRGSGEKRFPGLGIQVIPVDDEQHIGNPYGIRMFCLEDLDGFFTYFGT